MVAINVKPIVANSRCLYMKNIEKFLFNLISSTDNLDSIIKPVADSNLNDVEFELLKSPRWSDDAVIFKVKYRDAFYTLKIHYDKYPLACHIYNTKEYLELLNNCDYIAHITKTFSCKNKTNHYIRCVIYPYIDGVTLEKRILNCREDEIPYFRHLLFVCTENLFNLGFNPFIRDLADFIVTQKDDCETVVLTDYNALMDCHNSSEYSRKEIMSIMNAVIEGTVSKNYKAFISVRPTLTDL